MMMFGIGLLVLLLVIVLPVLVIILVVAGGAGIFQHRSQTTTFQPEIVPLHKPAAQSTNIEVATRYCAHCGAGLQAGWSHCPQCGAPVE